MVRWAADSLSDSKWRSKIIFPYHTGLILIYLTKTTLELVQKINYKQEIAAP